MLHSGIDLHKRTLVLATVDGEGTRHWGAGHPTVDDLWDRSVDREP